MEQHSWLSTKFWGSIFFVMIGYIANTANQLTQEFSGYLIIIYLIMVAGNAGVRIADKLLSRTNGVK